MLHIGHYQTLEVLEQTPNGFLLGTREETVLLPTREASDDAVVGARLRVFLYTDSEDRPVATLREPLATVGQIAALQVVDENRYGAFLDWGLPKDLFVPRDDMVRPMVVGQRVVVGLKNDKQGRVIASSYLKHFFDADLRKLGSGDHVKLLVYGRSDLGYQVVIDGKYAGLIAYDQVHQHIHMAQELEGWIGRVREDGRVDVTLQRLGQGAAADAEDTILAAIDRAGGTLPLHDKSSPQDIERQLHMSKKVFKKAIGALYRKRKVLLVDGGVRRA